MKKYKAFTAKRAEIIRDVNRTAWAKAKRNVIDSAGTEQGTTATIQDSTIMSLVNFEAYKATRKHVIENIEGTNGASISIAYVDAVNEADIVSLRIAGTPIKTREGTTASSATVTRNNIKSNADKVSWKVANCRIDEQEKRAGAQMDETASSRQVFGNGYVTAISNIYSELDYCLTQDTITDADHTFSFSFNDDWNGNIHVIKALIQQYIEAYTLYEWFKVVMPSEASAYLAESEKIIKDIAAEAKSGYNNDSWLLATWKRRVGELNEMLRLYISSEVDNSQTTATFNLSFSTKWLGSIQALQSFMQKYVVDGILRDWFALVMPAATYAADEEHYRSAIINELASDENARQWYDTNTMRAAQKVSSMLRQYMDGDVSFAQGIYTFGLKFPAGWGGSTASMAQHITDYMADYVLCRWFSLEVPEKATAYETRLAKHEEDIINEAMREIDNYDWFERQLQTAVDHLKGRLRWCINEHLGTITDNTIKTKALAYGDEEYPSVEQDPSSFADDEAFLDASAEKHIPIPEYIFRFAFSQEWRGSFEALGNYIHRYIVDYILYEWFRMTLPSEAPVYLASAEQWDSKVINEARSEDVRDVYFRL